MNREIVDWVKANSDKLISIRCRMPQHRIAMIAHTSQPTVSYMENGRVDLIAESTLLRLYGVYWRLNKRGLNVPMPDLQDCEQTGGEEAPAHEVP